MTVAENTSRSAAAATPALKPGVEMTRTASIISPFVDFLCVGGLSMMLFIPLLLSNAELGFVTISAVVWLQIIINYAHFMVSYRIVYRDRETIMKHQWATIRVPLIMLACLVIGLIEAQQGSNLMMIAFFAVGSGYLAWHYTGQTWGMMSSFSRLRGIRFDRTEYWLIRGGLRILLCWHLAWFLKTTLAQPGGFLWIYQVASAATVLAGIMGLVGLLHLWRRTGEAPPFLAVVAWASIFVWYAAVARWGLAGLFLVQLSHALQYLEFPVRVEINRAARDKQRTQATHMLAYFGSILGVTLLVTLFVPGPALHATASLFGAAPDSVAPVMISYFIGIHHFFTDGVIWKLRNPEVQQDLFAHAIPVDTTSAIRPLWWERAFWQRPSSVSRSLADG